MTPDRDPGVLVIGGRVAPGDVPGLCARLARALEDPDLDTMICDVGAVVRPDAATIHALARLQLTARRLGRRIRLVGAAPELVALLAFTGLAGVVPARPRLRVEPVREPEQREQPFRVEERVQRDDPAV